MSDLKYKDKVDSTVLFGIIGLAVLFVISIIIYALGFAQVQNCVNEAGEWNSFLGYCEKSFGLKGVFAYNDIYNTCSYYSLTDGKEFFSGYCYASVDKPDKLIEACVTGCLLEQPYEVEDRNWCVNNCKINLINSYKSIIKEVN